MSSTGSSTTGTSGSIKLQYVDINGNTQNLPFPIPINQRRRGTDAGTVRNTLHGDVILFDSFEDANLHWNYIATAGAVGNTAERSFDRAYHGKASLRLRMINNSVRIARPFYSNIDRIGLEVYFAFNQDMRSISGGQALFIEIHYFDGANEQTFRIEY